MCCISLKKKNTQKNPVETQKRIQAEQCVSDTFEFICWRANVTQHKIVTVNERICTVLLLYFCF